MKKLIKEMLIEMGDLKPSKEVIAEIEKQLQSEIEALVKKKVTPAFAGNAYQMLLSKEKKAPAKST